MTAAPLPFKPQAQGKRHGFRDFWQRVAEGIARMPLPGPRARMTHITGRVLRVTS